MRMLSVGYLPVGCLSLMISGAGSVSFMSLSLHQSCTCASNINRLCEPVLNARLFLCLLCRTTAYAVTVRVYLTLFLIVTSIGEVMVVSDPDNHRYAYPYGDTQYV